MTSTRCAAKSPRALAAVAAVFAIQNVGIATCVTAIVVRRATNATGKVSFLI